jgi:hypothetical protein
MRRLALLLTVLALMTACDSGPEGPGDVTGSVRSSGQTLGAAVVEVVGGGIESFSGTGGTKVIWAQQENPVVFRVIVIAGEGGSLDFNAKVIDRGGRLPRATVVGAVDAQNQPIQPSQAMTISFHR